MANLTNKTFAVINDLKATSPSERAVMYCAVLPHVVITLIVVAAGTRERTHSFAAKHRLLDIIDVIHFSFLLLELLQEILMTLGVESRLLIRVESAKLSLELLKQALNCGCVIPAIDDLL